MHPERKNCSTKEFTFKTQPAVGSTAPIKIAVIGDIGSTYNTTGATDDH